MRLFRRKKTEETIFCQFCEGKTGPNDVYCAHCGKHLQSGVQLEEKPLVAVSAVMITDPANLRITECKVFGDNTLEYKHPSRGKSQALIVRDPHVLEIDKSLLRSSWYSRTAKLKLYTLQSEGELTHDPHIDDYDPEFKKRFEALLKIQGRIAKTNFAAQITAGMGRIKAWFEYIPYIVIAVIVLFFLLAMSA